LRGSKDSRINIELATTMLKVSKRRPANASHKKFRKPISEKKRKFTIKNKSLVKK